MNQQLLFVLSGDRERVLGALFLDHGIAEWAVIDNETLPVTLKEFGKEGYREVGRFTVPVDPRLVMVIMQKG